MQNVLFSLDAIIEFSNFQALQDKMADYLNMAIVTVDYKGHPVTQHSNCSPYCSHLRSDLSLSKICEHCDSLGGIEAARNMKPYIYVCHQGLVDIAIPILHNDIYLGSIMLGQVLLSDPNDKNKLNVLQQNQTYEYQDSYMNLPKLSYERINTISDLVFFFCNKFFSMSIDALTKASKKTSKKALYTKQERSTGVLQPALSYMKSSFDQKITLEYLAEICNITPTYFSRLFKKTMNTNLVDYLNDIRISQAKIHLLTTNKKISQIATEVGFSDCGYFIKVFKQKENMTPNEYRDSIE